MKYFVYGSIAIFFLSIHSGCGKKASESTSSTSTSNESVSNVASLSIDSTTDALSEGSTAGTSGFLNRAHGLSDLTAADTDITVTRACTVAAGVPTVLWTRSGSGSVTKTLTRATIVSTLTGTGTESRVWKAPTGKTLACNTAATGVRVDWSDATIVNGLTLEATVDRSHKMSHVITRTRTNTSSTITHENTTKGTRTSTWSTPTITTSSGTTTVTMAHTVALNHTTTINKTPADGGTALTQTSTVVTEAAAPLSVTVVRSGASIATSTLQSKTITSGTIVSTDASTNVVTKSKFSNVTYDLSSTNTTKCVPVSGTITGEVFESATATNAVKKFTVTFGDTTSDSGVSMAVDGGTAQELTYTYQACDLAREG